MRSLRLPTVRWPLLLLLVSIAFTALGVFEANRAIRTQRAVAEHALQDYAGFAAWSYEQHLREMLGRATSEVLAPVNHGEGTHTSPRIPNSPELAGTVEMLVHGALTQWLSELITVSEVRVEAEESTLRVNVTYSRRGEDRQQIQTFSMGTPS